MNNKPKFQQDNGCLLALRAVLGECKTCALCNLDVACSSTSTSTQTTTTQKDYDCAEVPGWRKTWNQAQQQFCCKNHGSGCDLYECENHGKEEAWSPKQKEWCCEHRQKGCQKRDPFDCHDEMEDVDGAWSEIKRTWCCRHTGLGCATRTATVTTTGIPYNCLTHYPTWETSWDEDKKLWCCERHHRGCPDEASEVVTSTTATAVDSVSDNGHSSTTVAAVADDSGEGGGGSGDGDQQEDTSSGEADASADEQEGEHAEDCLSGFLNWQTEWSDTRKKWCCRHRNLGCGSRDEALQKKDGTATAADHGSDGFSTKYDCATDLLFWKQLWSYERKDWCCKHEALGCYECTSEPAMWPHDQLEWCCRSKGIACEMAGIKSLYDESLAAVAAAPSSARAAPGSLVAGGLTGLLILAAGLSAWRQRSPRLPSFLESEPSSEQLMVWPESSQAQAARDETLSLVAGSWPARFGQSSC